MPRRTYFWNLQRLRFFATTPFLTSPGIFARLLKNESQEGLLLIFAALEPSLSNNLHLLVQKGLSLVPHLCTNLANWNIRGAFNINLSLLKTKPLLPPLQSLSQTPRIWGDSHLTPTFPPPYPVQVIHRPTSTNPPNTLLILLLELENSRRINVPPESIFMVHNRIPTHYVIFTSDCPNEVGWFSREWKAMESMKTKGYDI